MATLTFDLPLPDPKGRNPWLGRAVGAVIATAFVVGAVWFIVQSMQNKTAPKKPGVQQIAILKQPPPPPPKPAEKLPDPPKVKDEVKIDQPKPEALPDKPADPAPADKPLALDADGAAGADGFGLAANKGGRDITTIGATGSGGGSTGRYYTGLLQRNFFEALARNRKAPQDEFSVVVKIWIGDDGRIQRTAIVNSSGNTQIDQLIEATLADMAPLREVPPGSLRQVLLRLNRRA